MNKQLLKIANTVNLQSYNIEDPGLIHGKMGIALFLYEYSRHSGKSAYRKFADGLLDEILRSITKTSNDFENGLSGIGWATCYLMKNGFIDGDPDDILEDVDNRIFLQILLNTESSLLGHGHYLIERLNLTRNDLSKYETHIDKIISYCQSKIRDDSFKSLYFINSMLFVFNELEKIKKGVSQFELLKKSILITINTIFDKKRYDSIDLKIFQDVISHCQFINIDYKIIDGYNEILSEYTIESHIKYFWLSKLYHFNPIITYPSEEEIDDFINNAQQSLTPKDFTLYKGLSGLGFSLIEYSEKN
jgi:hypothetical protein